MQTPSSPSPSPSPSFLKARDISGLCSGSLYQTSESLPPCKMPHACSVDVVFSIPASSLVKGVCLALFVILGVHLAPSHCREDVPVDAGEYWSTLQDPGSLPNY
ncbi:hypothetical protein PMIN03_002852 [Paraphaeosphaeria minitans]